MFQTEMRHVIAQRKQEVILRIVARSEKKTGLLDQVLVVIPNLGWGVERGRAIGGDIQFGRWILRAQRHDLQILARDDRTIHQHGQRNRRKMNVTAHLIGNMQ